MTTSITSNPTYSALSHNGVEVVKFDGTGIKEGAGRRLAQIVTFQTGAVATGTTTIPYDNTIPQNTEGDQFMSLAITPQNASSTLEIDVLIAGVGHSVAAAVIVCALMQDSNINSLATSVIQTQSAGAANEVVLKFITSASSLSTTTFKVRLGSNSVGTTTFNGYSGAALMGGTLASRITIKEYLP